MIVALNAAPIVAARLRGMRPQEMIRVSLVGTLATGNHVVYAKPNVPHDWRWVRDLDIVVYIGPEPDWAETVKAIAKCRPKYLCIWHSYEHWGAKVYLQPTREDLTRPLDRWHCELDFLEWLDFQNDDFLVGRTYARTKNGMPYATYP